ncbi:MAG: electron transfer flavoprotein subunit beta/FixA family protein [Gemmatimonadales bacterium]|nr:electron transfer flavoprotein subunit beta/FixA family protein [Gemmatimonadales bacterium]
MKIAVCLKRVPDTTAKIAVAADRTSIDEAGVKFVPNPYDEFALEAAIALKEAAGAGETVVIGLGPDAVQETLRSALAMGIDRAVHLQGAGSPDARAVATALAAELKDGGYDLVLLGKMAVDDYNHAAGPMVAELLGLPCVTAAVKLSVAGGALTAEREVEGGVEVLAASLPAVVTCDKGLNNPRLPSLKGIMAAKKKPLDVKPVTLPAAAYAVTALELPAERQAGRIVGEGPDAVAELVRLLRTEAKVL